MTREEYKAKLKGLHPQMDCYLEWKYTQEYITSLEAWIAELEAMIERACAELDDVHTPDCIVGETEAQCGNNYNCAECWRLWLMHPDPPEE